MCVLYMCHVLHACMHFMCLCTDSLDACTYCVYVVMHEYACDMRLCSCTRMNVITCGMRVCVCNVYQVGRFLHWHVFLVVRGQICNYTHQIAKVR